MGANQLALTEPSLFALTARHPLSAWWEVEEDRVVVLLEAEVVVVVEVDVVDVVVLDVPLVPPLRNLLKNPLKKTLAMSMAMTMTMAVTMIITMTMTWTMKTDLDVLGGLHAVAQMGLDHLARIT